MIKKTLKEELLNTKTLKDFQNICKEHRLKTTDVDMEILEHFSSLGHGGNAYNHTDPRKVFKWYCGAKYKFS